MAFSTPTNIGELSKATTTSTLSNAPVNVALVDATTASVFVRVNTVNVAGAPTIQIIGTWGEIHSLGGAGNGGGGGDVQFPINFPVEDLGTLGAPTIPIYNFSHHTINSFYSQRERNNIH